MPMPNPSPLSLDELIARLVPQGDTLVLFHRNPDPDAVGSAFALKMLLEDLGSRAFCVCESELPEALMRWTDHTQASVLPSAIPADFDVSRIIAVDTASPAQLGDLRAQFEEQVDLLIDHHRTGDPFADYYIQPDAAATGEIIFDIAKQLESDGLLSVTEELCILLYAAISADTGGFRFSNVTPATHMRAAELMSYGIDCAGINHLLFNSLTLGQLRARSAGISNLRLFADGRVAVIPLPYAIKAALGLEDEHMNDLVDVARSLEGVRVAISIRQPQTEGVFRVSCRASGKYDVAALCAIFGGGGHKKAAGCTIEADSMDEAIKKIVDEILIDDLV